ncbi:hypothetical protein AB0301_17030 [Microbacterium profundi]|uniref:Uncharacterized protein n=1 Tax=Microbacterium profundi TaxID=450380 RepID=A0ABV3LLF9_9MICO
MDRLEADGIIHEVTNRKRNRLWAATGVLSEMTELTDSIERAAIAIKQLWSRRYGLQRSAN